LITIFYGVKLTLILANYANVLVLLLRLRQACCHPHLIKDLSQPATEGIAEADLLTRAQELAEDVVTRLKLTESFECPICFEVDVNPTIIIPCGHTICGECVQKLVDPTNAIRDGNEDGGIAKCPHCRGELKASRITDYKHFCKVFCPEKLHPDDLLGDEEADENVSSDSDDEEESEDDRDEADEKGNLAGFVVSDEDENDEKEDDDDDDKSQTDETGSARNQTKGKGKSKTKGKGKGKGRGKGKGKARAEPKKTLAQLKKDSLKNKAAKAKYLRRLRKTWMPSAKIEKTMQILDEITKNDPTEKILIFSQFTSLLDLLEVPISDKKMSLNLAKASQVILLDPFWNPFVEEQAVDRAHRMPQPREVTVHRVLVPETVEDRIIALQDKKRDLIEAALDENTGRSLTRLNVQELRYLFGMGS
jgi:SNF2 family DNA or RNA helicase